MKKTRDDERGRWAMCFGALGMMVALGVGTAATPRTAEAQPSAAQCPTPTKAKSLPGAPQFNRACGRCHPNGDEDTGPKICGKALTTEQMTKLIRGGQKRMKAIPPAKLSDADLGRVMQYLRAIRAVQGAR